MNYNFTNLRLSLARSFRVPSMLPALDPGRQLSMVAGVSSFTSQNRITKQSLFLSGCVADTALQEHLKWLILVSWLFNCNLITGIIIFIRLCVQKCTQKQSGKKMHHKGRWKLHLSFRKGSTKCVALTLVLVHVLLNGNTLTEGRKNSYFG